MFANRISGAFTLTYIKAARSHLSLLRQSAFEEGQNMDFEQAKKVLQLTDAKIRKFDSIDASTSNEIHDAIFKFQPFERLVIAYHAQEALTQL